MDHVVPFPDGRSDVSNCDTKCVVCHQLKTGGHVTVTGTDADGSRTWATAWGQTVRIPPRPFLHDPDVGPPPRWRQPPPTAPEPAPVPYPRTPTPRDEDEKPPF